MTLAMLAVGSVIGFLLGLVYLAVMLGPGAAAAQGVPVCSWPLETTGTGPSNVAYPDTNATYWTMPFDSNRWKELVITGAYPEARFFSLQGLQMLEESIEEILYLNPRLEVLGILLSKMDRRLKEERQVAEYLRQRWGVRVFTTEVGTNSKILEAGSAGTSVFHYVGADRAVETYLALADEVLTRG